MNPINPLVFAFPGYEQCAMSLVNRAGGSLGQLALRPFPDGETYVRLDTPVDGRPVVLVCGLERADAKLLPLLFAATTARELGAPRVGVVAPYLGYMRQDMRFRPGEAVTSRSFAAVVSRFADWLVCVDPHLHRHKSLDEIYSIPTAVVPAASAIADWIRREVGRPVIIGPDEESEQWVAEVARLAHAPFSVLRKIRRGDRDVEVSMDTDESGRWREHTPVLIDDIVSTAHTMIRTVQQLLESGYRAPVCIGVHAVFAQTAWEELLASGAAKVVTCNTIAHPSNAIDVTPAIAAGAADFLELGQV